jgi:DNA-binding transcriptional regulator YhcF (GntR family)
LHKFGKLDYYQLEVDHIDFKPTNHYANNLQFLTPQENTERSNSRPCRIWEKDKEDAKKEYPSVVAAAKAIGYSHTSVHTILKNNINKKWRGEYL